MDKIGGDSSSLWRFYNFYIFLCGIGWGEGAYQCK